MNKKAVALLAVVAVLGLAAFWIKEQKAEPLRETVTAAAAPSVELEPTTPVTEVHANVVEAEAKAEQITRDKVFPQTPGATVGFVTKHASLDFDTYLVFMEVGAASELVDGQMTDVGVVQYTKALYGLTDEEVARLVDYSRSTLVADRAFQTTDQEAVCAKRSAYQSVQQFGAALNEHTKRIESNQESLGRTAAKELESELYSKISDKVLGRPRREMTNADFPVLMAKRNHGLEVGVERFCNFGK